MCIAGLLADAKHLVARARDECALYKQSTSEPIPLFCLTQRLAHYIHMYTLYSAVRPFGVSVMLSSVDKSGPSLYMIEPSGLYYVYI